ncbi:MAG: hypothetical protein ABSG64_04565 [Solirubrobacteraceae bacterium]|jgi:hypothetical protein
MSTKRHLKSSRRQARKQKTVARQQTRELQCVLPQTAPASTMPAELRLELLHRLANAPWGRREGDIPGYHYDEEPDDFWYELPAPGVEFRLPLTAELEEQWRALADHDSANKDIAERIIALRAQGRESVTATLPNSFWWADLADGTRVHFESDTDEDPVDIVCPELAGPDEADAPFGVLASDLGMELFAGEVAWPDHDWMEGEDYPRLLARREGQRWPDGHAVSHKRYDQRTGTSTDLLVAELCPPVAQLELS